MTGIEPCPRAAHRAAARRDTFIVLLGRVRYAIRAAEDLRELGDPRGSLARGLLDSLLVDLDRESGGAEA